ncbi:ATP-binding cassette domain-containing protein [Neisseria sp. Ec49-e6-T10]|uniref:ATP-binding cassette domain-containing protein n=1 Tax=Neisseria sp. Ec49-e6-T10 TaxID=3140744 RepID=UPI003EBCA1D9
MPNIVLEHVSFQFNSSDFILHNISYSFGEGKHNLIGHNGVGKSVLASLLAGNHKPSDGKIIHSSIVELFSQQFISPEQSIASFLNIEAPLKALHRILSGHYCEQDMSLIGDNWALEQKTQEILAQIEIFADLWQPFHSLSGGEQTRLRLLKHFQNKPNWLILDEPSNHLDIQAREWLKTQIKQYPNNLLLISHDLSLLEIIPNTHELTPKGILYFHGNIHDYLQQKFTKQLALQQALEHEQKTQKILTHSYQRNKEHTNQRAIQGKKLKKSGSQSKLILDRKADKATLNQASLKKRYTKLFELSEQKRLDTQNQIEATTELKLSLNQNQHANHHFIFCDHLILPYGHQDPITFFLKNNEQALLMGKNGSGKSTLLHILSGRLQPKSGCCQTSGKIVYLDQHQSFLLPHLNVLANFEHYVPNLGETNYRTLLANIGLKKHKVYSPIHALSGGEKIKLALLIIYSYPSLPILLLDEPDNHLDIMAKKMLINALQRYKGMMLLVSHDSDFLKQIDIKKSIFL